MAVEAELALASARISSLEAEQNHLKGEVSFLRSRLQRLEELALQQPSSVTARVMEGLMSDMESRVSRLEFSALAPGLSRESPHAV